VSADGFRTPVHLIGRHLRLAPLDPRYARDLSAAVRGPDTLRLFRSPPGEAPSDFTAWIEALLAAHARGTDLPFVTILRATDRPVGMTRYLRVDRANRSVEIGGTWLDPTFWGSPLNTESKLLLLRHAFDEEGVHRVQFQTDLRNVRSQRAIEALGAVAEARFREDVLLPDGKYRTSIYYSILEEEWPAVRDRLEVKLRRAWSPPPSPAEPQPPVEATAGPPTGPGDPAPTPLRFRPPVRLLGRHVQLVPLERTHVAALTVAGADPEIWTYLRIRHGDSPEGMSGLVDDLLALQDGGGVLPLTVLVGPQRRPSGITRYLEIDRENRWVEVGTWIDRTLWRTPVNTEIKYLVFRHAFETEGVHRVQLGTNDANLRSQRAIERLGATREGPVREHYLLHTGQFRTSIYYSILASEWPSVRARLEGQLARPWRPDGPDSTPQVRVDPAGGPT
jgi:N-acetyltransferase